jgi:D-arabinose 5-phosphate isomerase GutQ
LATLRQTTIKIITVTQNAASYELGQNIDITLEVSPKSQKSANEGDHSHSL